MKNVKANSSEVAAVLPVCPNLSLEVQEWNPVRRDRRNARDLRTKELRRRATAARTSVTSARLRALAERTNDALVESLDAAFLLFANLGLRLDEVPELQDVFVNLVDVDVARDGVTVGHLLDVRFELADVLAVDFGVDDLALLREFRP